MQGDFIEWLDESPLLQTFWYDSSTSFPQYESSIHTITERRQKIVKIKRIQMNITQNQPTTNFKDNCTAAVTNQVMTSLIWIIIPCNSTFEATFICQKPITTTPVDFSRSLNPFDNTCEDGWIFIKGSYKCFKLLKMPEKELSFVETQNVCSAAGGSVMSLNTDIRPKVVTETGRDILYSLQEMIKLLQIPDKRISKTRDTTFIFDFFFGKPLYHHNLQHSLAYLLYFAENGKLLPLRLISRVNGRCGILILSVASIHTQRYLPASFGKGFGAKYRPCWTQIGSLTGVICEKPIIPYIQTCREGNFKCADSSCILAVYVCDQVNDCFDGSDERTCYNVKLTNKNNILLPCMITANCFLHNIELYVPIHSICDGINYFNLTFDQYICEKHIKLYINIRDMQNINSKTFGRELTSLITTADILRWYKTEVYYENLIKQEKKTPQNTSIAKRQNVSQYMVPCRWMGEQTYLENRCKISVHETPCNYGSLRLLCKNVLCPGMFKCEHFYCIHMSAVCDGQHDCYHGEDEKYCSDILCPGLLKCRGENRCVSKQEICDGHIDCIYSNDDEVICNICARGCECIGTMAYCNMTGHDASNSTDIYSMSYIKGLVIKISEPTLYVDKIILPSLMYLNLSSNQIQLIDWRQKIESHWYVMFADFSDNFLNSTHFLYFPIFSKLVFLDLKRNYITRLDNYIALHYLNILYLSNNPLVVIYISISQFMPRLKCIELEDIPFHHHINFNFLDEIEIQVSDSTLCCIISSDVTCLSIGKVEDCYGLIPLPVLKWCFYCLTIISLVISVVVFSINIIIIKNYKTNSRSYIVVKINRIFADVSCSTYILFLVVSDIINVDTISFQKSFLCMFLNAFSFINIEGCLIFKTLHTVVIMLKTLFPFNHQCRWLRFVGKISGFIWLILSTLHAIITFRRYMNNDMFFDEMCSFMECKSREVEYTLAIIAAGIDATCLIIIAISLIVFLQSLKRSVSIHSTVKRSPFKIFVKLCRPFCSEIFLRLYFFYVLFFRLFDYFPNRETCFIITIILIPINITITSLWNLLDSI